MSETTSPAPSTPKRLRDNGNESEPAKRLELEVDQHGSFLSQATSSFKGLGIASPAPDIQQQPLTPIIPSGSIMDAERSTEINPDELWDEIEAAEVARPQMVIDEVPKDTHSDVLMASFGHIKGYDGSSSHINDNSHRAFIYFLNMDAYLAGLKVVVKWGKINREVGFDPMKEHDMYFRVFLSTLNVGAATLAEYRQAVYQITGVWPSSITLNDQKRCLCVYFEDAAPWLSLLREYLITVTPEKPPKPAVVLRCVPSFAATTSPKWCKFFIGNLPDNVHEHKLYKFFERLDIKLEFIGLFRDAKTNKIHNFGFIFTQHSTYAAALREVGQSGITIKRRLLKIEDATGRRHPPAAQGQQHLGAPILQAAGQQPPQLPPTTSRVGGANQ